MVEYYCSRLQRPGRGPGPQQEVERHNSEVGQTLPTRAGAPTHAPRGIKYATPVRPLPRRPVSSSTAQHLPSHYCTAATVRRSEVGGMKVAVVSRSGREVVKGGIDIKDSVRACRLRLPPFRPPEVLHSVRGLASVGVFVVGV
jgi:hypothetical protein